MPNALQGIPSVVLLLVATILEVSGDAVIRTGLYTHTGLARAGLFLAGAALLFGYGTFLNLAPDRNTVRVFAQPDYGQQNNLLKLAEMFAGGHLCSA